MFEVLLRFPAIGSVEAFQGMPRGERILYEQFVLLKMKEEVELAGGKLVKKALT